MRAALWVGLFCGAAVGCGGRPADGETARASAGRASTVRWHKAGEETAVIGPVRVDVLGAKASGHINGAGQHVIHLAIYFIAFTEDPTKQFKFTCWLGRAGRLEDEFGNTSDATAFNAYQQDIMDPPPKVMEVLKNWRAKKGIALQIDNGVLASDRPHFGALQFEPLPPAGKSWKLTLSGEAVELDGSFCFVIDPAKTDYKR